MKYRGRQLKGPREKIIPIIRDDNDGGNIILVVRAITDMQPFYDICPQPEPPKLILPGGKSKNDVEDKGYQAELKAWFNKRTGWQCVKALEASPEIEWEQVKIGEPDTYPLWEQELRDSGFSDYELNAILTAVMDVNGINEALVEEARQSFLTSREAARKEQSSPTVDPKTTSSGEPVSESASVPQA